MFSTIVVGTDGSDNAKKAQQVCVELAKQDPGCAVHVVVAHHPLSAAEITSIAGQLPEEMRPLLHAHIGAETILAEAQSVFALAEIDAEFHEIDEDPSEALLGLADRIGADLLIVGSRGHGLAKRALHGSVSTKVLHHAPCSVLVVKDDMVST